MQTIQNKSFTFEVFILHETNLYLKYIVLGPIKNITLCSEIHIRIIIDDVIILRHYIIILL